MQRTIAIGARAAVTILVLALIAAAGRGLLARKRAALARSPTFTLAAAPVQTAAVYSGDLEQGHEYLAVTEPFRTAILSARVTATVENVGVQEGDTVNQGDILIALDERQIRDGLATLVAQIAQADAELAANEANVATYRESLAYWERERDRDRELARDGTIPQSQAEATGERANEARGKLAATVLRSNALEQQVKAAQRRADELRTTLTYSTITSPFAGVVTVKEVDPGTLATPGKPLLVVEDRASVKLAFDVPQSDLPEFRAGLPATFTVNGATRHAAVSRVYPSLSRARMVRAEVVLEAAAAADLPLGAYISVTVVLRRHENVTLAPIEALVETRQGQQVFVVRAGVLEARPVTVLGTACEAAAITGVEVGERLVISSFLGWARLAHGTTVEERP